MHNATITLGLLAIVVVLWLIYWKLRDIHAELTREGNTLDDIFRAQLNPRTRIGGPVKVQSGAVSDEQKLEELGRLSRGKRIVVGGDDDSQLNRDLTTTTEGSDHG